MGKKLNTKILALWSLLSSYWELCICIMHQPNLCHKQKDLLNPKEQLLLTSVKQLLQI